MIQRFTSIEVTFSSIGSQSNCLNLRITTTILLSALHLTMQNCGTLKVLHSKDKQSCNSSRQVSKTPSSTRKRSICITKHSSCKKTSCLPVSIWGSCTIRQTSSKRL
jgi:hypothetical protein